MNDSEHLTAIEAYEVQGCVAIPHGLRLNSVHDLNGVKVAHVGGATQEKLFDQNLFDLYQLSDAKFLPLHCSLNGLASVQAWWQDFKEAVKEARLDQGEWKIRPRVTMPS